MEQNDKELVAVGIIAPIIAAAVVSSPVWGPEAVALAAPLMTTTTTAASTALTTASIYGYTKVSSTLETAPLGVQKAITWGISALEYGTMVSIAQQCSVGNQDACASVLALGSSQIINLDNTQI